MILRAGASDVSHAEALGKHSSWEGPRGLGQHEAEPLDMVRILIYTGIQVTDAPSLLELDRFRYHGLLDLVKTEPQFYLPLTGDKEAWRTRDWFKIV